MKSWKFEMKGCVYVCAPKNDNLDKESANRINSNGLGMK